MELSEGTFLIGVCSRRLSLAIIACACAIGGFRCMNPFAPRLETDLAQQTCSDFTNIDDIFCAFRNSYTFKDTTLYGSFIAPTFLFSYRDYDQGVDVSWGRDDEMRSTYGLFQSVESLVLIWNNTISADTGETQRTVVRGFNLTVTFNPGDIERVSGYASLTFERPDAASPWKIARWHDESNY